MQRPSELCACPARAPGPLPCGLSFFTSHAALSLRCEGCRHSVMRIHMYSFRYSKVVMSRLLSDWGLPKLKSCKLPPQTGGRPWVSKTAFNSTRMYGAPMTECLAPHRTPTCAPRAIPSKETSPGKNHVRPNGSELSHASEHTGRMKCLKAINLKSLPCQVLQIPKCNHSTHFPHFLI